MTFYTFLYISEKVQINFILFEFFSSFFILGNKNCPALLFQFLNFSKSLLFCSFINLTFAKEPTEVRLILGKQQMNALSNCVTLLKQLINK